MEQFFDDFADDFASAGAGALPGEYAFWRFNRTQDYGYKGGNETAETLSKQFDRSSWT